MMANCDVVRRVRREHQDIFFSNNRVYVTDDLSLPGECQARHDYVIVRRFSIVHGVLRQDAVGIIRYAPGQMVTDHSFRTAVIHARLRGTPWGPAIGPVDGSPQPSQGAVLEKSKRL